MNNHNDSESVVSLQNVSVNFKNNSHSFNPFSKPDVVQAVNDVTLNIDENDVIALVGESGCGKTTLGKTAIGVQQPTHGKVRYRGQDLWATRNGNLNTTDETEYSYDEMRQSLQIIHQDPGSSLNPNKTVMNTLSLPLKVHESDMTLEDRRARIYGMLERVGMSPADDYANRYPHQLSGGEKQRVALVRALLMNPDLILADEAVSALDVSLRVDIMDLMLELQDEFNTSFLFISHNISNASYLAGSAGGRIGIMYLGEIVEIGPVDEVIENPKHPYTKVLKWATPNLDPDTEIATEPPIRKIDVPDPVDPPKGCRFHTRCPEAREACKRESPELDSNINKLDTSHQAACFRVDEDHDYWNSSPLKNENQTDNN
jgi:peptide/nickel transport system ATP-binding protein